MIVFEQHEDKDEAMPTDMTRCQAKLADKLKPVPKLGVEIEAMPSRHQSITARGIQTHA